MRDLFQKQLQTLRARSLERKLREISSAQGPEVQIDGQLLINFSSNDYLGLANDFRLREAAIGTIKEFGVGAGASRLVSGTQSPHLRLETALAKWKETEAALSFSSGYAAALAAVNFLGSSEGEERRRLLWKRVNLMRELLPDDASNRKASDASSAIFPWIVGDEQAAIDLASALQSKGFLVPAIRYPTVAKGSARLRVTVTASHGENQIRSLCEAIKRANERRAED